MVSHNCTWVSWYKDNEPEIFIKAAVEFNHSILCSYQQSHNLYGGGHGGLENYFVSMREYFGQSLYDQIVAGFMSRSSVYLDSMNLSEWHIYGSSRHGIYATDLNVAYRMVQLIMPDPPTIIYKPVKSGKHESKWKSEVFSGLAVFSQPIRLI